jgi:hypothetical protein
MKTDSPIAAILAAWLDAELFMRTGDTSCKHSTRLFVKTKYNKVTDDNGNTIGWTHAANDGTGYYSQAGLRPKKNFFGFKHEMEAAAVASLKHTHSELMKRVEVI